MLVLDLRHILAMLANVAMMLDQLGMERLPGGGAPVGENGDLFNCRNRQMIAIDPVEDCHVKGRRRRAFLAKAVNMDVVVIGAVIRQAMDHIRVAMVREYYRLVGWKYPVEVLVGKPVRMLLARLQRHEVDNVDHPDAEIGKRLAQKSNGGQRPATGSTSSLRASNRGRNG
jgi:hypothetical protein